MTSPLTPDPSTQSSGSGAATPAATEPHPHAPVPHAPADARSAFAIPAFRALWVGRFCSTIGQMAMVVIIGWQVYDIARGTLGYSEREAAFQLGLIGLAQFVPLLLLTLVVGWVADRADRRWIARITLALEAGCAGLLTWLTYADQLSLPWLFFVAIMLGVARAFASPALGALAPNLVPASLLPNAIALSSIAWQTGAIAGPAIGGLLYAELRWAPYALSAILFTIACLCLMRIGPVPRPKLAAAPPWRQMIDGMAYVRQNRLVLGAISLDLFAVLLGGATAMLPVFARDILHVGPHGLGLLRAAPGVGASLVALLLAFYPIRTNVGVKMLLAVIAFGAATVVFGFSRSTPVAMAALLVLGAADMVSVYVRQSLIQIYTPDAMRGRVAAVSTLFISGSNELGEAESGFLAALVGPVVAVVAGGLGAIGITLLWWRIFPELRRARTFDPPVALTAPEATITEPLSAKD